MWLNCHTHAHTSTFQSTTWPHEWRGATCMERGIRLVEVQRGGGWKGALGVRRCDKTRACASVWSETVQVWRAMVWPCRESRQCKRVDRLTLYESLTFLQQGDFLDAALHLLLQDLGLGLQLSKNFRHRANDANTEQNRVNLLSGIYLSKDSSNSLASRKSKRESRE